MMKLNLKPSAKLKTRANTQRLSTLSNAVEYFLHHVVIIEEKDHYRLIVVKNNEKLMDMKYRTSRGAAIAFSKSFKHRCTFRDGLKSVWNQVYQPEPGWLDRVLSAPLAKKEDFDEGNRKRSGRNQAFGKRTKKV
jgi:hypothetical protein